MLIAHRGRENRDRAGRRRVIRPTAVHRARDMYIAAPPARPNATARPMKSAGTEPAASGSSSPGAAGGGGSGPGSTPPSSMRPTGGRSTFDGGDRIGFDRRRRIDTEVGVVLGVQLLGRDAGAGLERLGIGCTIA